MGRGVLCYVVLFHRWRKAAAAGGCLEKPSCVRYETSKPETSHKRRKLFPVVRTEVYVLPRGQHCIFSVLRQAS